MEWFKINFVKKSKLTVRKFFENTIYEVNSDEKNDEVEENKIIETENNITKLTPEEEEKEIKKK